MLPEWDRTLFDGLILVESCYKILERLKNALDLVDDNGEAPYTLFVSDGSAGDDSMSFGWVVCMQNNITLARSSGPAPGHRSSFHSEGYSTLSAVQFLHHLFEYCQDNFVGPYRFVTDNQGLITRVQDCLRYPESFPNGTLAADWDVVNEIAETLTKMRIKTSFHHVKGHQDDKVAYEKLTLEAHLNEDADAEAGGYRYHHPEPWPKVPRLPTNAA
jgi:hypothetical protein